MTDWDTAIEQKYDTLPVNEEGQPICYVCRRSGKRGYAIQAHEVRGHGYRIHLCALGSYGLRFRHQGCNDAKAKERRRRDHARAKTPCSTKCCPGRGRAKPIDVGIPPKSVPQDQLELA